MTSSTGDYIEEFLAEHKKRYNEKCSQYPDRGILYHFTGATGFLGIINTDKLWATDCRFVNDKAEIQYGATILNRVLEKEIEEITHENMRENIDYLINSYKPDLRFFIFCLCDEASIASQWLGYGQGLGSVAIGFDFERIHEDNRWLLLQVEYNVTNQEKIVQDAVNNYLANCKKIIDEGDTNVKWRLLDECMQFERLSAFIFLSIKDPIFRHELEWRLVEIGHADKEEFANNIKYRPSDFVLTPYIELEFKPLMEYPKPSEEFLENLDEDSRKFFLESASKKHPTLPIKKIYVGPSADQQLSWLTIHELIRSKQYFHVDVQTTAASPRY